MSEHYVTAMTSDSNRTSIACRCGWARFFMWRNAAAHEYKAHLLRHGALPDGELEVVRDDSQRH